MNTITNISVVKKTSLFEALNKTREVKISEVNSLWKSTLGGILNFNSYSNLDKYSYFIAILEDGSEVYCKTKRFSAAYSAHSYYHSSYNEVIGTDALPTNWIEIRFCRFRYISNSNKFAAPNYTHQWYNKETSGIVVAKNNNDGTATLFKTWI